MLPIAKWRTMLGPLALFVRRDLPPGKTEKSLHFYIRDSIFLFGGRVKIHPQKYTFFLRPIRGILGFFYISKNQHITKNTHKPNFLIFENLCISTIYKSTFLVGGDVSKKTYPPQKKRSVPLFYQRDRSPQTTPSARIFAKTTRFFSPFYPTTLSKKVQK